ncbi:response regulator transcription factor [Cohnella fermenti]|uniref:Response regulator transcription factor n=1 Tax=Cohnella fermenti TaxID=2565925 RepID=A0A4S4C344_9BACL|nr:response regulator transcription factor [Cohnella fermenti]
MYSGAERKPPKPSVGSGDLVLDFEKYSVKKKGQEVRLTAKEFDILKPFVTNRNRVFTKA